MIKKRKPSFTREYLIYSYQERILRLLEEKSAIEYTTSVASIGFTEISNDRLLILHGKIELLNELIQTTK